jgi:hypothetical protein
MDELPGRVAMPPAFGGRADLIGAAAEAVNTPK